VNHINTNITECCILPSSHYALRCRSAELFLTENQVACDPAGVENEDGTSCDESMSDCGV